MERKIKDGWYLCGDKHDSIVEVRRHSWDLQ